MLLTVITKQLKSKGPEYTTVINKPCESKYCSRENILQQKNKKSYIEKKEPRAIKNFF